MKIGEVIGKVTLSRWHPSLDAARWLIAVPLSHEGLEGNVDGRGEPYVIYDDLGASEGAMIAISEGAEAAAPFHPATKPIDAYNAAILDEVSVDSVTE